MRFAVAIRPFEDSDLDAVVEFSLRAWEPVHESLREVLGDPIFVRLHQPDWRAVQSETVRSSCMNDDRDVFVAIADGRPVGFVAVALNAFHERMGVVDIIAVDPAYQRRGIATELMNRAADHMRDRGMDIAAVGTGGDPGHAPARAMYEASGYTALASVRYLKLLDYRAVLLARLHPRREVAALRQCSGMTPEDAAKIEHSYRRFLMRIS